MYKVKQVPQKTLLRATMTPEIQIPFKIWAEGHLNKMKSSPEGVKVKEYTGYSGFPQVIKDLYGKIHGQGDKEDKISPEEVQVGCRVYPPGCHSTIETSGVNDSVALWVAGGSELIVAKPDPSLFELVGFKLKPEMIEQANRHIYFRQEGGVFIDTFPFSIVSNYEVMSRTEPRYLLPAGKGGRAQTVRLSRDNKWIVVFTRTCGNHTIKKIIRLILGQDIDLEGDMSTTLQKLMKSKKLDKMVELIRKMQSGSEQEETSPPEVNEDILDAFNSLE